MNGNENKTCGVIVSDVPLGDPEHDKLIHELGQLINRHVDDKPDKPKIRNRCGTCLVYHTPFCVWQYKDYDIETMKALHVDADAYACSSYYSFKLRARSSDASLRREYSERSFEWKVARLEEGGIP